MALEDQIYAAPVCMIGSCLDIDGAKYRAEYMVVSLGHDAQVHMRKRQGNQQLMPLASAWKE